MWTANTFAADIVNFAPHDGVLLLRNGAVLAGRITPMAEAFLVYPSEGGEIRVPRTEVDFDCSSLEQGYQLKRDWLDTDDLKSHLALADWCLRHGLLARAADQLLVAGLREPNHPQLKSLERRLIARVFDEAPRVPQPASVATSSGAPPLVVVKDVDPSLVQMYTTTIQPILFNRCASFQCHGGGSSAYRLIRPGTGQVPTSRLTQRNLQATLVYVDRNQPESSRLLNMAQQPHGHVTAAIFHEKTGAQLELLATWVRKLKLSSYAPRPIEPLADAWRPPIGATAPAELPPDSGAAAVPAARGAETTSAGGDPFDPAAFNRRYHDRP
ncbi:MAG: hypothetical protein AB7F89_23035 [Pirellulaceae bacterium]